MSTYKCLVVDDEPPAIALLEKYIGMIDQLEIVGTCHSAVKAFDLLKEKEVDLLFLDIRMPLLNGIDFLKTLKHPPAVIMTTAYREYAIDGYDLDIIDYLLKPISFERFLKAIDRHSNKKGGTSVQTTPIANNAILAPASIFFNVNKTHHKVLLKDILYIESLKDYVRIHTKEEQLVVKGNLGTTMKRMPANDFVRIHRSFAIAIAQIKAYNQTEVDINGEKLPIGASYREELLERLG